MYYLFYASIWKSDGDETIFRQKISKKMILYLLTFYQTTIFKTRASSKHNVHMTNTAKIQMFGFDRVENIVGKGQNAS